MLNALKTLKVELENFVTQTISKVHVFYQMVLNNVHAWVDTTIKTLIAQFASFKSLVIAAIVVVVVLDFFTKGSLGVITFTLDILKDFVTITTVWGKAVIIAVVVGVVAFLYREKK